MGAGQELNFPGRVGGWVAGWLGGWLENLILMKTQSSVWTWTWTLDFDLGFVNIRNFGNIAISISNFQNIG